MWKIVCKPNLKSRSIVYHRYHNSLYYVDHDIPKCCCGQIVGYWYSSYRVENQAGKLDIKHAYIIEDTQLCNGNVVDIMSLSGRAKRKVARCLKKVGIDLDVFVDLVKDT